MTLSGDYERYGWKSGDVVMVPSSEDDASAERYMWQPGDVVFEPAVDDLGEIERHLTSLAADMASEIAAEDRTDDLGRGYNPNRTRTGEFAPGPHHDKKTARVARAQGHADKASGHVVDLTARHGKAVEAHRSAVAASAAAVKDARAAASAAKRSPTAANISAWQAATSKAIRAKAAAGEHAAVVDRHEALLEKAHTTHAIAQAKLHEAQRSASQTAPTGPRSIELHPHGVGFERIPGEGDHAFEERSPSPEFSFSPGMARIHGEGEHAVIEPPKHEPPPPKESGLDILSRTRPNYVHVPVVRPEKVWTAEDERQHQEHIRQQRKEWTAKIEAKRSAGILDVPGVSSVYLPEPPKKR